MDNYDIYKDIAERTEGDIYIGVVGPVRTGKSTFIKRFMDILVLPNIDNANLKERVQDELPQSAAGKTIMTTEPKFVPEKAVEISLNENTRFSVRLVDCVGYMVKGAMGYLEGDRPRMITTPWYDYEIPFEEAAEIGTKKVINDHSTIGLVVTTDGSITDIPRDNYVEPEERVVKELKDIQKPFIILLNTTHPEDADTIKLGKELETKYDVPVVAVNVLKMGTDDIKEILEKVLYEFPITELNIDFPRWVDVLENDHWLKQSIMNSIKQSINDLFRLRDIKKTADIIKSNENMSEVIVRKIDPGEGIADIEAKTKEGLFFKILSDECGLEIRGDRDLMKMMKELSYAKSEYDKLKDAIEDAKKKGVGVVPASIDNMEFEKPEIVRQGGSFAVRLRASAPSLHIFRTDVTTEVSPIVGTEKQSEDFVKYITEQFENDPDKIWESNIFGKSLSDLVKEGMQNKLGKIPENVSIRLRDTLERIVNDGGGGIICIIL
ncbi:stage IV sporulation protein A [Thermoanaerobacterium thermosaccharolyticum]|uniref:Stage IV sporulation protein A n=1 Tax=Thermoanaerobacterium thermosaccharolyticum TaxID=1517 RepID=A0A223I204_THETR|nr:stage IV sporulation protein A [Thermoanaerobacterium thermosaccharolyticum]AST58752.1 stage IV sporulation protein A [Thermoanaerobacterium thermosaccharolyticum]PHO06511.1 stage IV sporulation protein A [Thermoanaerobacterium thermosaccharolyticum]